MNLILLSSRAELREEVSSHYIRSPLKTSFNASATNQNICKISDKKMTLWSFYMQFFFGECNEEFRINLRKINSLIFHLVPSHDGCVVREEIFKQAECWERKNLIKIQLNHLTSLL